jgi:hypothetical protein
MSHFLIGAALQREGKCGDAIPAFARAIEAKRREPQAVVRNLHAGLADCLARTGREADAEREFQAGARGGAVVAGRTRPGWRRCLRPEPRCEARTRLGRVVTSLPQPTADATRSLVRAFNVLGDTAAPASGRCKARARCSRPTRDFGDHVG